MNSEKKQLETVSKFLSFVLRHHPEKIALTLDGEGWASVDELVALANAGGHDLDRKTIEAVVAGSDKQRFAFSDNGKRIRANQGHSVDISLGLSATVPPDILYHGTASRFLNSIRSAGLHAGQRQHVHLSREAQTAAQVGARHGSPVVLAIDTKAMNVDGYHFFLSKNGVWLTAAVPPQYIRETSA